MAERPRETALRVVVAGLGVQGKKRAQVAGDDVVATVDPARDEADFRHIEEVPLASYDAVLCCVPDSAKLELMQHLLARGKHVLVEKPLLASDAAELRRLRGLAAANRVACYTAYNHRFEPHIARLKEVLDTRRLGRIYLARFFYGNGTACDVRGSPWRDQGAGVLPDIGSHLLDMALFMFGRLDHDFRLWAAHCFENRSPDHVVFGGLGEPLLEMEMTLLSWRNHFTCDLYGELGSAHISSLCKWGPTKLTIRDRKLPSGRPDEESIELVQPDPTWNLEYAHFRALCRAGESNLENDLLINEVLSFLAKECAGGATHCHLEEVTR